MCVWMLGFRFTSVNKARCFESKLDPLHFLVSILLKFTLKKLHDVLEKFTHDNKLNLFSYKL
jgi:hypothetical protein